MVLQIGYAIGFGDPCQTYNDTLYMPDAHIAGVDQIFVHVDRQNAAAQKLYAKLGFQVSSPRPSST